MRGPSTEEPHTLGRSRSPDDAAPREGGRLQTQCAGASGRATPSLRRQRTEFLILIDGLSQLDCRATLWARIGAIFKETI
jgi:hypothetical protein